MIADIARLGTTFAIKRRAYLNAHAADCDSPATKQTYNESENALDELMDKLWTALQMNPEAMAAAFLSAPHVRMHPRVFPNGTAWCCLYGDDLQQGIAGFGNTPAEACEAFDRVWNKDRTPAATLKLRTQQTEDSTA